jgi:hypothetical protein
MGNTCDTTSGFFGSVPHWDKSTFAWFATQTNALNSNVARAASSGPWKLAKLEQSRFKYNGYCAGDFGLIAYPWYPFYDTVPHFMQSFFLGILEAKHNDNEAGGFHPNKAGHGITAGAVEPLICNALFGNATCEGPPKK